MASKKRATEAPYNIDLEDTTQYIDDDEPVITDKKRDEDGKFDEGGPGSGPSGTTGPPKLQPEQMAMRDINPNYNPNTPTPRHERLQLDPELNRLTEDVLEPETPEDEEYGIYEEVPVLDDEIKLDNTAHLTENGEYQCPECGETFYDIESYETHLPAVEDSTISVSGPPTGDQIPANMLEDEETEEEDLLSQLLDNEIEEEDQGHDETEDIAIVTQLLEGENKKKALKTDQK